MTTVTPSTTNQTLDARSPPVAGRSLGDVAPADSAATGALATGALATAALATGALATGALATGALATAAPDPSVTVRRPTASSRLSAGTALSAEWPSARRDRKSLPVPGTSSPVEDSLTTGKATGQGQDYPGPRQPRVAAG